MPYFNAVGFIDDELFPTREDVMREYRRRYALAAYHQRRDLLIARISPNSACFVCAKSFKPSELVLCWKDEKAEQKAKKLGVKRANSLITINKDTLDAVLEKNLVELLCDEHAKQKLWGKGTLTHGTYWAAYRHRCTCDECLEYRADHILRRREDRRYKKMQEQVQREAG